MGRPLTLSDLRQDYPQRDHFHRKTPPATQESVNDALDRNRGGVAELVGVERRQFAHEPAERGADGGEDDDGSEAAMAELHKMPGGIVIT